MNRTLNLRFAFFLLVIFGVLGGVIHVVHGRQIERNAESLFARAKAADAANDPQKATGYVTRYLGFRPDDVEAVAFYAGILEKAAQSYGQRERAFLMLERALRLAPDRDDLRTRSVALAMDMGRYTDAKAQIDILRQTTPDTPERLEQFARCDEELGNGEKAAAGYRKVIAAKPDNVESYSRLALLYRRKLKKFDEADQVMADLIKAVPNSFQARLARARYYRELGLLDLASQDLTFAREKLGADDVETIVDSADLAQAAGKTAEARKMLEDGVKRQPKELRYYLGLATLELREKRLDQALVRLREARDLLPDQAGPVWVVADMFINADDPAEAGKLIDRLDKGGSAPAAVNYLRARLLMRDRNFAKAVTLLEQSRPELAKSPELALQADLYLAFCHAQLGHPEQQLAATESAIRLAPTSTPAVQAHADALLANGKTEEAISEYRRLATIAPDTRLRLARLVLAETRRLAADRRDWTEFDAVMRSLPEGLGKSADAAMLAVEGLAARGKLDEAKKFLVTARDAYPKEPQFWLGLVAIEQAATGRDGAIAVLTEAEAKAGDLPEFRIVRGRFALGGPEAERVPKLKKLEEGIERLSPEGQTQLLTFLSDAYVFANSPADADRVAQVLAAKSPNDLAAWLRLFDLASRRGDDAAMKKDAERLREIEGDGGAFWCFAEAARQFRLAEKGDAEALASARAYAARAIKQRPQWSRALTLSGLIEERLGNAETAIEKYSAAVEGGESEVFVVQRLHRLLMARRRYDEAKQVVARLRKGGAVSPELSRLESRMETELSVGRQSPAEVALLVDKSVPADSKDAGDQIWRGQVLLEAKKKDEAGEAFRRAVALDDQSPTAWVALVAYLTELGELDKAKTEVEKLKKALKGEPLAVALSSCYQLVGDRAAAEQQLLALVRAKPGDLGFQRGLAVFYIKGGELAKAEPILRTLTLASGTDGEAVARWARRAWAVNLALTGEYRKTTEALALLDENLQLKADSPEDLRARAVVYAMRPSGRKQSIRALEDSFVKLRPSPEEEFLLAQIQILDGNWKQGRDRLLGLLNGGGDNPMFIAYYVRQLIRRNEAAEAAPWVRRLEVKEPAGALTAEIKARWLAATGDGASAAKLLTDFADKSQKARPNPGVYRGVAQVLEQIGRPADAERMLREYISLSGPKNPQSVLVLAEFLARQGKTVEGLDACDGAWKTCPPEAVAQRAVAVLRVGKPTEADFRRVGEWIDQAVSKHPGKTDLLLSQADLLDARGNYDEAIRLYRKALEKEPENPLILNNLAWLVALHERQGEAALEVIDRAVAASGPQAQLLDTRGVILTMLGRGSEAAEDLSRSAAEVPLGPTYFHLAQAQLLGRNKVEALRAMRQAKELDLKEAELHPLEQAEYRRVRVELGGS